MHLRPLLILTLAAAGLLLAACDGAGSGASPSPARDDGARRQYLEAVRPILEETIESFQTLEEQYDAAVEAATTDRQRADAFRDFLAELAPLAQDLSQELQAVDAPAEIRQGHQGLVTSAANTVRFVQSWTDKVEADPELSGRATLFHCSILETLADLVDLDWRPVCEDPEHSR